MHRRKLALAMVQQAYIHRLALVSPPFRVSLSKATIIGPELLSTSRPTDGHHIEISRSRLANIMYQGRSAFEPPVQTQGTTSSEETAADVLDHAPLNFDGSISEPSQAYDSRGHPQNLLSRVRVRRDIRAYNEVLATVAVCARVDAEGKDLQPALPRLPANDKDESYIEEKEIGFCLNFTNELLRIYTTTVTTNLRQRIQVWIDDIAVG